jgi:hypothetical protein
VTDDDSASWRHIVCFRPTRKQTWWSCLIGMLLAIIAPVLLVEVPPLLDYPNHLARAYIHAAGSGYPVLNAMFESNWAMIPNLALDLIVPPLVPYLGIHNAGRIAVATSLLLMASGSVALSVTLFKQKSFWQLGAAVPAINALFLMGFLNFQLAIGTALWSAAAWVKYRAIAPTSTIIASTVFAVIVFFFHLFGLLFLALLLGCYELVEVLKNRRIERENNLFALMLRRGLALTTVFIMPCVLYGISSVRSIDREIFWFTPGEKLLLLFAPFLNYNILLDGVLAALLVVLLFTFGFYRRLRCSSGAVVCTIVLATGYFFVPAGWKGGFFVDTRISVLLGAMLFIAVLPYGLGPRFRTITATLVAVTVIVKVVILGAVWLQSQKDVAAVRAVVSEIPPGSRVLLSNVWTDVKDSPLASLSVSSRRIPWVVETYMHLAAFVLLDRHAFWSHVFAAESQQPLRVAPAYQESWAGEFAAFPEDYRALEKSRLDSPYPHLRSWETHFDYVLVLNADHADELPMFLPQLLEFRRHIGIAALFSVRKP